ncbi:MAG: tyrosine-type recombinase/integrase, partial [Defluviicoccus sp.]|nr:tyrosine-type recombinase/integrase [Defluviicoccus sp.]
MSGKERRRLTDAAIARLRTREREYTVWDRAVSGLGVRVRPTGGKSYVLLQQSPSGAGRVSLGPVSSKGIDEVRRECHARRALPEPEEPIGPKENVPLFRDFVEGPWKEAHFDRYKPSTRTTVRIVLSRRVLPAFGSKPLDRIATTEVRRWFDAYSRTAPGGANRTLDILRQIMNYAIARGHIETNPTRGVRRNRRTPLTRFLSREEIGSLHRVLDEHAERGIESRKQADIIRLLLLTGCRKGEIVRLRWAEVRDHMLMLADSKTGPRKVPLNSQARRILDRQPRGGSEFVFPSPLDPSRPRRDDLRLWYRIRKEASIEDVRLHDLRHTHASHAVMNGVPVPLVSRLLGHSNVRMTLRYAHLEDRDIEQAAERVGQAIAELMELDTQLHPLEAS